VKRVIVQSVTVVGMRIQLVTFYLIIPKMILGLNNVTVLALNVTVRVAVLIRTLVMIISTSVDGFNVMSMQSLLIIGVGLSLIVYT